MSKERDRVLGMDCSISRRDFLNGCALTVGASLAVSPEWFKLLAQAETSVQDVRALGR